MRLWVQPPILLKKIKREFQLKDISCLWTELKVFFILTRNGTFIGSFEKGKSMHGLSNRSIAPNCSFCPTIDVNMKVKAEYFT